MSKQRVSASQVLNDIRDGMDDSDLRAKYHLSSRALENLFRTLADMVWQCPQCGTPQAREFDICPECGANVSELMRKSASPFVRFADTVKEQLSNPYIAAAAGALAAVIVMALLYALI
ncbi:MAG: zinc ribbon domain-containing protein [Deltaproteobacteria bacterium]